MSGFLTPEELRKLKPAERLSFASPIPTQIVSSDEYYPAPQNKSQREVEARLKSMGNEIARKQGISRRAFFSTAAGMAAAYLVMNKVYGGAGAREGEQSRRLAAHASSLHLHPRHAGLA